MHSFVFFIFGQCLLALKVRSAGFYRVFFLSCFTVVWTLKYGLCRYILYLNILSCLSFSWITHIHITHLQSLLFFWCLRPVWLNLCIQTVTSVVLTWATLSIMAGRQERGEHDNSWGDWARGDLAVCLSIDHWIWCHFGWILRWSRPSKRPC